VVAHWLPGVSSETSGERGAAGIEFAVAAMMFFTLLFGIVYYGLYFFILVSITNIAAESARASIPGTTEGQRIVLANAAAQQLKDAYGPLLASANPTPKAVDGNPKLFQVTVTYNFGALGLGVLGNFFPVPTPPNPSVTIVVSNGGY
jgi:Flp pilus assembly protein TadG